MIRGGFLSDAERQALTAMARDGLAEHRVARRANAIVVLDKGWSCAHVAGALLLDDDTVREWFQAYETGGLDALSRFGHEGSSCRLTLEQQAALQNWITLQLPRSTRAIGAWLEKNHGFNYSRPGLINRDRRLFPIGVVGRLPVLPGRILHSATQDVTIVNAAVVATASFVLQAFLRMPAGYGRDVW